MSSTDESDAGADESQSSAGTDDAPATLEPSVDADLSAADQQSEAPVQRDDRVSAHAEKKALRFAIPDLDRALTPVRRLSNWLSESPRVRTHQVPYLERVVARWTDLALQLQLPESILDAVRTLAQTVEGYDSAPPIDRVSMVQALAQHLTRIDATLGFPLRDVRVRMPRKPKFAQRPETPETPAKRAIEPTQRADRGRPARGRRRGRVSERPRREEPPPALLPFWNGRPSASVTELPIRPSWIEALIDANLETVADLLWCPPESVESLRPIHGAGRDLPEGRVVTGGRVLRRWTVLRPDGAQSPRVRLKGADVLDVDFESQRDALEAAGGLEILPPDARVILVGTRCERGDVIGVTDAELAYEHDKQVGLRSYGVTGLSDGVLRGLLGQLLPLVAQLRDPFPTSVLSQQGLDPLKRTVAHLHHGDLSAARKRLAFDEALVLQAGLAANRHARERDRGQPVPVLHGLVARISEAYDLLLNDPQQAAFEEIKRDLRGRLPMRRVLTGDIGCGRNKVVMLATACVTEGKAQVLHMCADAMSAEQRFLFAAPLLKEGGLVARLLHDEPSKAMRDAIARGEVHVVFGTVDLMKHDLAFRRLGLVIAEERGRYGEVGQWLSKRRQPRPHALLVPPIPVGAALSLTAFAECDISCISRENPEEVAVSAVPASSRDAVYERARAGVAEHRQVVVMFPMVKGDDALDLRSAVGVVRALESDALKGCRVGLFHSKMPREERLRTYSDFMRRRYDVLVATGPVEDAPQVPGVAMVVVEQADRVDALRLQRIRGILRRGNHAGEIVLVCGGDDFDASEARLGPMFSQHDGFALSDEGVAQVGLSQLVAEESPPLPQLRWLNPATDRAWMWQARALAQTLLRDDARLRRGWAVDVAAMVSHQWPALFEDLANPIGPPPDDNREAADGDKKRRRRRRRRR